MNSRKALDHKLKNLFQTVLLIVSMSLLLAVISRLLLGPDLWLWVIAGLIFMLFTVPGISPRWLLHVYQARLIQPQHSPQVFSILQGISDRAALPRTPRLYWIPSRTLNAFAVGSRNNAAIAITDGLLRTLNPRELAGVIAHEVSHIRNNDLQLMTLADLFTRLTHSLSLLGILIITFTLPLMITTETSISLWGLILLVVSPSISALLQFGLSRVREFDADLDAVRLTGDPRGLASALARIDQQSVNLWQRIIMPNYHNQQPSVLRTHPDTTTRIERLIALGQGSERHDTPFYTASSDFNDGFMSNPVKARPRHRIIRGIWH